MHSIVISTLGPTWELQLCRKSYLLSKLKKKQRNFGHLSKSGIPYLSSSLVWTKISLGKSSYCLPYLPIQKDLDIFELNLVLKRTFSYFSVRLQPQLAN